MEELSSRLRKLGAFRLQGIAGDTIVSAIRDVASADTEKELSEILLLKYGTAILKNKTIRLALIDVMSVEEAGRFCGELGIDHSDGLTSFAALANYFGSFGLQKSKKLADFLGLDSTYYAEPPTDDRTASLKIEIRKNEMFALKPYLHDYQKRLKDQLLESIQRDDRFLLQMPTGAGKTYMALEAVVDLIRKPRMNKFIVWLVDSNELSEQALQSFSNLWKLKGDKELYVYRLFGEFCSDFSAVETGFVFASFDKLYSAISDHTHPFYSSVWYLIKNCELLIVDEAHTSVAETYEQCIRAFLSIDGTRVVGLTATPGRPDPASTSDLVALYGANLISMTDENGDKLDDEIEYLQAKNYLARLTTLLLETGIDAGANGEKQLLIDLASNSTRNRKILDQIELANELQESTLVFACNIDHVLALTILCKSKGIVSEFIIGDVDQRLRLEMLNRFKNREFYILINLDILSAGVDLPNVDKIIITRPIGSPIQYSQILGRALRGPENGGNARNTVINLKDNLLNYPNANFLYKLFEQDWNY